MNMEDQGQITQNPRFTTPRNIKAIVLLSGGLDSAVAAKLMQDQGIDLVALNFHSPFCTCASNMKYNGCSATYFASKMNIPIKMLAKGDDYLAIVKHPRFGYGKNMNPCIDCRIYLFKKAWELLPELGAKFIVTGEVLGQRPKSQMRRALDVIDKESGVKGYVLRPLSAKLLPPTIPEQNGWVDRDKLLSIEGRQRNLQVELGKQYKLCRWWLLAYRFSIRGKIARLFRPRG
jgi:tRNA-specific 2-thiouridylase